MYDFIRKSDFFSWMTAGHFCDQKPRLKSIQYAYILSLLDQKEGLRIAEIGGGNSRVLNVLKGSNECWNIDKFQGMGNGPIGLDHAPGIKTIEAYLGDFDRSIPTGYFDVVFSISVVEHVSSLNSFFRDIERILKPGGTTFHAIDLYLGNEPVPTQYWRKYFDIVESSCLHLTPISPLEVSDPIQFQTSMVSDPDINMWKRNALAPQLTAKRENDQCVSLRCEWQKHN